jgi:site-specific DNA-cytosine methylase
VDGAQLHYADVSLLWNAGEIANMLCFPKDFTFPASVTTKQAYRLLGNSINVYVVSLLLRHLLCDEEETTPPCS